MREFSVPVSLVRSVLAHAPRMGIDTIGLLLQSRIPPGLLEETHARVSIERFSHLQVAIMLAMDDEGMGHYVRRIPVGAWSIMCHYAFASATLGEALHRYCRYFRVLDIGLNPILTIERNIATVRFEVTYPQFFPDPFISRRAVFKVHRFSNWLIQEYIVPLSISLPNDESDDAEEFQQMYPGAQIRYGQPQISFSFGAGFLEKRIVHDEQSLRRFIKNPSHMMLTQRYARNSWITRVKELLRRDISSIPDMETVADKLHVHSQTLRRRLAEEGTSFTLLRDQTHRDLALHYVGKRGLSIHEIAYRLGFTETSTFIRAFKRWTGVTPFAYRKGLEAKKHDD